MAAERQDDGTCLYKVFPIEVWETILSYVDDATTYRSISDASPELRALLLLRAPEILFAEVMQVFRLRESHPDELPPWLPARKVYRTWRDGLDRELQTHPPYFVPGGTPTLNQTPGNHFPHGPLNTKMAYMFETAEQLTAFEEHFDSTHLATGRNPFIHNKVQLHIYDDDGLQDFYYAAVLRFLRKYGRHVGSCIILYDFEEGESHNAFLTTRLSAILALLPNIRGLQLEVMETRYYVPPHVHVLAFSTLPRLEHLVIVETPTAIVEELLRSNRQVRSVDARRANFTRNSYFLESLPELREVRLCLGSEAALRDLENARFRSRVEKLWLGMSLLDTGEGFKAHANQFSESLEELHVRLPQRGQLAPGIRLRLSRLRTLHVEMAVPQPLDFLVFPQGTLEQLRLTLQKDPMTGGQVEHDPREFGMYAVWKNPNESSIWLSFPNLRNLEVKLIRGRGESPMIYKVTRKEWQVEMQKTEAPC